MPVLQNARWERFAQELAKGKTADEAYREAGYNENRGNAARLKANEGVEKRVAELLNRSAERAEISVARLTEDLLRIAGKAEALDEAPGLSVARAALMDAAKLNGLVIERSENENTNVHYTVSNDLPDERQWEAERATAH